MGPKGIPDEQASPSQQITRSRTPDFPNPQLHAVYVHPALGMMMYNYTWRKLFFRLGLSFENDHWLQLCTVGQAGKDDSEAGLLIASCSYGDGFFSSSVDCSGRWHVEPDRSLVHIANVHKFIVGFLLQFSTKRWKFTIFSSRSPGSF